MAADASAAAWYSNHERSSAVQQARDTQRATMPMTANGAATYLPSIFPDNFKDFFAALNEDADDPLMEDKLLPRRDDSISNNNNNINKQRWAKRAFQRRSSEIEVRPRHYNEGQNQPGYERDGGRKSPTPSRRRSSSIAVARLTPDLHRFLQTEGSKPWGHLEPKAHSPTALSPGSISTGAGASPSGPSPTNSGPANLSSSRLSFQIRPRGRTSSMPAVPRHRPMLVETRRAGGNPASPGNGPDDAEGHYYRVRSFSISANGCIENLGDLLKSKSITSVTSSSTSSVNRDRLLSSASQLSNYEAAADNNGCAQQVPKYKVGIIGASNTGKTSISCQLCTSEYVSAFSNSLDDEYGQKNVSVMVDGQEAELEVIDHPTSEMSLESFCSTYAIDLFVLVYAIDEKSSFKLAENYLLYLWKTGYMNSKQVILCANKIDLQRKRVVTSEVGRRLANTFGSKFIEVSAGLNCGIDNLLCGIVKQVSLNKDRAQKTQRRSKRRRSKMLSNLFHFKTRKTRSCEDLFAL